MTRGPAHLQLMKQADETLEAIDEAMEPSLTSITGTAPDDGHLVHPATRRRGTPVPSRHEAEGRVIGFAAELVDAPKGAAGRLVRGPGEAALVALRGARDARPALKHATVVLPASAHPAYFTAAATLGLLPVVVPVDPDGRAPLGAMTAAIRDDTVLVVASAPSFSHGTIDPIGWIGAAAAAKQVPLHVDAASGGWALAYAERAGRVGASWGFAVGGVSSVAIDVGPESGTEADLTVVLHRDSVGARGFSTAELARGPLALPTTWTRPGGLLVDALETLDEIGHEGCSQLAIDALDATAALVTGLLEQRGVVLAARPDGTAVSLRADTSCDVFTVADGLEQRGWTTEPVLPETGVPLLRLQVTAAMLPVVDELLEAIAESVAEAQQRGRAQVDATLERLLEKLDPDEVRDYSAHLLLDAAATLDHVDPERTGRRSATNLLLAAAEPGVREALLAVHLDRLVTPVRPADRAQAEETTDSTDASE